MSNMVKYEVTFGDRGLRKMLEDPQGYFSEKLMIKELANELRLEMYSMISRHFEDQVNPDGTRWADNTETTERIKMERGLTRLRPPKESIEDPNPLIGSGDWRDYLTQPKNDHMHWVKFRKGKLTLKLGASRRWKQAANEEERVIQSKIFRDAVVPQRSVLWWDDFTYDQMFNIINNHLDVLLLGE